jgi:hypothetical protein
LPEVVCPNRYPTENLESLKAWFARNYERRFISLSLRSTTPLGGTLGALAGLDTANSPSSETEKSQRETIIELVSEFMASLAECGNRIHYHPSL